MGYIKALAMYLPQFYRNSLNDKWWGDGYTDWVAVKGAEKMFEEHRQPRVPLNSHYYNLLEKDTLVWQAGLAREYGIYGFCMYHYWFEQGNMALREPAENLLKWKDIDINYCFSWANVTWATTWTAIDNKCVWTDRYERRSVDDAGRGIIKRQKYGDEVEWKKHFNYLLPFFLDSRYIKVEDKPVFVIYKSDRIFMLQPMIRKWNEWAQQEGLAGIYVIAEECQEYSDEICATMQHEPEYSKGQTKIKMRHGEGILRHNYDDVWNEMLQAKSIPENSKKYYMAFTDFDSSPRKGANGEVMDGVNVEKFEYYFSLMVEKSIEENNEFIFINAWNEWAEGMYLEPDTYYKNAWLQAVSNVMERYNDREIMLDDRKTDKTIKRNRMKELMQCLEHMLTIQEDKKDISSYFRERNIRKIAIYGKTILAKHFIRAIEMYDIEISYMIDQNSVEDTWEGLTCLMPEDNLPSVDMIVVSVTWEFNKIEQLLRQKGQVSIISLHALLEMIDYNE